MDKATRLGRNLAGMLLILAMAACSPIYRNHGYVPDDDQLELVEVGKSTREDVAVAVGRPSVQGVLDESGWFYVQSQFKQSGISAAEEVDREVVSISFDKRGIVSNVERFGLEQGRVVALSRRVTQSNVQGITFLKQLFRNLGRVDTAGLFSDTNF